MRRVSVLVPLLVAGACLALLTVPANAAAPAATGLPTITGNARAGQILTSTTGTFSGTGPLAYGRAWQRCDAAGAACTVIAAASAATYTLVTADVGNTIRVTVTASNLEGSASVTSPATAVIAPLAPPTNDSSGLPVISGTVRDGQILSATDGAWSGTAPFTFTRIWRRCDAAGAGCAGLAGAATHTLTSTDVGATIRVEVTAHNADGQAIATSAQTAVVDAAAPVNTVLPALSGPARSGQTLTSATAGTWTGTVPMTYARQWMRCDVGGGTCVAIPGAIGLTYVVTDSDIGQTIRVAVTSTNVKSSATASSAASATVGPKVPPLNSTNPSISGSAIDGQILTAADGTWTGTATIATTRRWQRCEPLGVNCVDLAATSTTLTLASADVGSTFRTRVTATNPDGTTQALSTLTATIAPLLPSTTAAPAVSGTAREGQLLTATQGTWKGTPTIAYSYAWQRCTAGGGCSAIAGALATTYRVDAADVGKTLRAMVTATNDAGATTAPTAPTVTVTGGIPVNLAVPGISGPLPRDGELYSATLGSWIGTAPLLYDRQWQRCNASGVACTALSGEISSSYRLSAGDIGKTVRMEVTSTNSFGVAKAQSAPSPVVLSAPPTADSNPTIAGVLRDGQTLTAVSAWSGSAPISLTYQWQRCDAVATTCVDVAGATASTYRLTSPEVGSRMRVRIGALNAGGGGTATSDLATAGDLAGLIAPDAPHATTAPTLTGTAIEEGTLTSSDGVFTGTLPLTRSIHWQRCDPAGNGCTDIAGATGAERVLTIADRGATLRAIVTAVNGTGTDSIASGASAVVALAPPRNLVAPAVAPYTGLRDGTTLTSTDGGWAGSLPMTLNYRWDRCKATCVAVPGAAGPTYMLATTDVGFTLRLVVTASNGAGSTSQASPQTGIVGTNPPVSVVPPTVAGTARDGDVLTAVDGVWTGPIIFETTYEWWRCDTLGANCSIVPGATSGSLVLSPTDIGLALRARVVRTSAGGTTGAFTAPTSPVIAAPPLNVVPPTITGGAAVGKTLTVQHGTWTGTPTLDFTYQWQRCAADGSACADIGGEVGSTYLATAADDDTSLRVVVTADNAVGSAAATSPATLEVQNEPPAMLTPPHIDTPAGPLAVGATLTAQPGTWDGAIPISFEYQWARCDALLVGCSAISAATASTYLLATADVGRRIVATVTATNVVDATTAITDGTTTVLPQPPSNTVPPAVTAASGVRAGARLVATTGTWSGAVPLSYVTTWLRCAADGTGCVAVAGATTTSYTMTADDVGHRMRASVTAANTTAEISTYSASTTVVLAAPPAPAPPTVVPRVTPPVVTPAPTKPVAVTTAAKPATATTPTAAKTTTTAKKKTAAKKTTTAKKTTAARTTTKKKSTAKKKTTAKKKSTAAEKKSTAAKKKSTTAKKKSTAKKKTTADKKATTEDSRKSAASDGTSATKAIIEIQRARITTDGRLLVSLRCPSSKPRACRASGTVVAGTSLGEVIPETSLSFSLRASTVSKGKTLVHSFKLTTAQREELRSLSDVNFRVRLAAPATPKRFDEVFVRVRVPAQLQRPADEG